MTGGDTPKPIDPAKFLEDLAKRRAADLDLVAIGTSLLSQFGGPEGFAKEVHVTYASTESDVAKARILTSCAGIFEKAQAKKPEVDSGEQMSQEELVSALAHLLKHGLPE